MGEAAALAAAAAALVAAAAVLLAARAVVRAMRAVQDAVAGLAGEAKEGLAELRRVTEEADAAIAREIAQVEAALERAEAMNDTIASASKLSYLAVSNPLIKAAALGAGAKAAARGLRRPAPDGPPAREADRR